ncbi:MAG: LPS-assembly protein LptD [Saprospiraceae bacterium]|nr:LPS-assembly protein LptD [Saprospiraceae bacterium]
MKLIYYIVFLFLICFSDALFAQERPASDTIFSNRPDTVINFKSGLKIISDSIPFVLPEGFRPEKDTFVMDEQTFRYSKDSLDAEVIYGARDSSRTDIANNTIHLYGNAYLEYTTLKIKAGYIVIRFNENIIEAFSVKGANGENLEKPTFSEGQNNFTYKEMRYNFKTKKGLVDQAKTKEGEFNLLGERTKFISKGTDSLSLDDVVYNQNAIITTCDLDHPHYGIRTSRLKFIPGKLAVMSFAQLELANVPTPIFLPFGFFPLAKGKSSGLIFPSSYEFNEQFGLGFREIGYYFPVSNYLDLRVTGDIYTRGSHALRVNATYKKRYGYSGNVRLGYTNNKLDDLVTGGKLSNKSFSIGITHNQDSKAHPFRRMGGSVNLQTNRYDQRTFENPGAALTNTYQSNFSYSHDMPGTPFSFNSEFRHSQNTQTRKVDITLPNISIRMNTINPFRRKNATNERWTDNIAVSYSSEFRNFVQTTDTTIFTSQTIKDLQTGMSHRAGISTNFRVLKYLNVSPNINYEEFWLTKKYKETFDNSLSIRFDTIITDDGNIIVPDTTFGEVITGFETGFNAVRRLNSGVTVNTQIFGTKKFSKGWLRGLRHVMKPTLNFNYSPASVNQYRELVDTDSRPERNNPRIYNPFQNGPFGTLQGNEEQKAINFGILNIFEAKYFSKKDSSEKILRLFDNINVNGGYNFAVDSFGWSDIRINGNTRILKGLTNFNFSMAFTPYVYKNNRRINQTVWDAKNRVLEFRDFNGQFSSGLTFRQIREIFSGKAKVNQPIRDQPVPNNQNSPFNQNLNLTEPNEDKQKENKNEISLADWFDNFNISHAYNFQIRKQNERDTFIVTSHSISLSGSIPLTKNWNLNIGNIAYDIQQNAFPYPYFAFSRDLHCWQMNFTWAPDNGTYSFFIGVKSTSLSFLKYDYGQRNAGNLFSGRR